MYISNMQMACGGDAAVCQITLDTCFFEYAQISNIWVPVMQLASFSCARDKQTERINHIRSRGVGLAGMKASQHINV